MEKLCDDRHDAHVVQHGLIEPENICPANASGAL